MGVTSVRKFGFCILALLLFPYRSAAEGFGGRDTLKGIRTVVVVVEKIPAFPTFEARLRTAVELRLRKAGVEVLEMEGPAEKLTGVPLVHVHVGASGDRDEAPRVYAVAANVSFLQFVLLPAFPIWKNITDATPVSARLRETGVPHLGNTWESRTMGLVGSDNVKREIVDSVEALTDKFINDYLAANSPWKPVRE